ncbi:MAG TPA: NAD(P)H-hydrate dehydratase [Polyangia bacterium]
MTPTATMSPGFPLVLTSEQMRRFDREATVRSGLPSLILMENAGRGVADAIRARCRPPVAVAATGRPEDRRTARRLVVILCGGGNNGGDGFVVARHLSSSGAGAYEIRVLLAAARPKIAGDAATMLRALDGLPDLSIHDLSAAPESAAWRDLLESADVVVDALLGTGLRDDVRGVTAAAIAAVNDVRSAAHPPLVVAIDIPSGLDADTGRPHGDAIRGDLTITMGARKLGLVANPAAVEHVGGLEVADLGVPLSAADVEAPRAFWIDEAGVRALLPARAGTAYKGDAGHLVVVAGSAGKSGAAALVGEAGLRAGAGLVTVASTAAGQAALDAKVVEVMTGRYADGDDADEGSFDAVAALLARPHVRALALGPGIPTGPGMRALVERLAGQVSHPAVIDADGLNLLGSADAAIAILARAAAPRILTPHPGEMARLTGRSSAEVQGDRLGCARAFAAASRAIVVLKGPRTLIVAPDGDAYVNPAIEPALGTAGSGDVLTGVIGGLLAQGLPPLEAAIAGTFLHGRAGARARALHGAPGTIAGDLPRAVAAERATLTTSV